MQVRKYLTLIVFVSIWIVFDYTLEIFAPKQAYNVFTIGMVVMFLFLAPAVFWQPLKCQFRKLF